jgi:hypothetical protein
MPYQSNTEAPERTGFTIAPIPAALSSAKMRRRDRNWQDR